MVSFPNCKINLGLNVIHKRPDGYHEIETIFYPLPFTDVLEILPADSNQNEFIVTGLALSNTGDNLCLKAYSLLKIDFPELPYIKMHLHKVVPMGAGLGGGSADAAFTLRLLNDKFSLRLSDEKLKECALQLGSDCPFFIVNTPCFAAGVGEILQEVNADLSAYKILLISPDIHVSTAWAFSEIKPAVPKKSVLKIINQPPETWKEELVNDFEVPVFNHYPELQKIKNQLYEIGSIYASLTGSGSAVYGLFKKASDIQIPDKYKSLYKIIDLK